MVIRKTNNLSFNFTNLPKDIIIEIFNILKSNDLLTFRETSKLLKFIVDSIYWKIHFININCKSSSPSIQEIKDIPCCIAYLSFNKWEENDIEKLLSFEYVTHLSLVGLKSWNFSTAELFNPYLFSYCISCVLFAVNFVFETEIGIPPIFFNVISLDLSNSNIGDYGVVSFVSRFKNLQTLNISNNDIGHNIIGEANSIANLNYLTALNLSENHFSSETIMEMVQLTNLTTLDISDNFIYKKDIIEKFTLLPKLIRLINNNQKK